MIYREEKGSPLSIHEMDDNFREIALDIQKLKDAHLNHKENFSITLEQQGRKITFLNGYKEKIGEVTLPTMAPHIRGKWTEGTSYKTFDWIHEGGKMYACTKVHTSKNFKEESVLYWEILWEGSEITKNLQHSQNYKIEEEKK